MGEVLVWVRYWYGRGDVVRARQKCVPFITAALLASPLQSVRDGYTLCLALTERQGRVPSVPRPYGASVTGTLCASPLWSVRDGYPLCLALTEHQGWVPSVSRPYGYTTCWLRPSGSGWPGYKHGYEPVRPAHGRYAHNNCAAKPALPVNAAWR